MGCSAYRIAHVVETIEDGNQVVVLAGKLFGLGDTKVEANLETFPGRGGAGALDGFVVIVKSEELRFWEALAISTVDAPLPQPTSATLAPDSSLACTPCKEGIHALMRLVA